MPSSNLDSSQAARLIGAGTTLLLSGYSIAFTQNVLPILFDKPAAISTPIFKPVFYGGAAVVAPGAVLASSAYAYLAYTSPNSTHRKLFATGATLSLGVIAFTRLVMYGGIQRLLEISGNVALQATAGEEVTKLLKTWSAQNALRAAMYLAAGVIGLVTPYV